MRAAVAVWMVMVVVALGGVLAGCSGEPKRQLRMNLPVGSSYELSLRSNRDVSLTTEDKKLNDVTGTFGMRMVLKIQSIYENGDYLASVRISNIDRSVFWKNFEPKVIGAAFSVRISPLGEVVELIGTDAMRESIRVSLPNPPEIDPSRAPGTPEEVVMAAVSDARLREPMEFVLRVWPSVPVGPGDTWQSGPTFDAEIDAKLTRTFTLQSWDPAVVTVSFVSEYAAAGTMTDFALNGSGSGEIRISPVEGVAKSARATRTLNGTIRTAAGELATMSSNDTLQVDFVPR